jgi:hypothetical protein
VFLQNATELAEQRFGTDSIAAGWYSATAQYAGICAGTPIVRACILTLVLGFFFVPVIGIFLDIVGHRISACKAPFF